MFSPVPVESDYSIVARKAVYTTVCVFSVLIAGLSFSGIIKIILSSLGMVLGYPGAFDHVYDYAYSIVTVSASLGHTGPSNYATFKNISLSRNSSNENLAFEREENKTKTPRIKREGAFRRDIENITVAGGPAILGSYPALRRWSVPFSLSTGLANILIQRANDADRAVKTGQMQDNKFNVVNNKLDTVIDNYDVISQDNRRLYSTINKLEMANAKLEAEFAEKNKDFSFIKFFKRADK